MVTDPLGLTVTAFPIITDLAQALSTMHCNAINNGSVLLHTYRVVTTPSHHNAEGIGPGGPKDKNFKII